jgi:hypothetical protein
MVPKERSGEDEKKPAEESLTGGTGKFVPQTSL